MCGVVLYIAITILERLTNWDDVVYAIVIILVILLELPEFVIMICSFQKRK